MLEERVSYLHVLQPMRDFFVPSCTPLRQPEMLDMTSVLKSTKYLGCPHMKLVFDRIHEHIFIGKVSGMACAHTLESSISSRSPPQRALQPA